MGLKIPLCTDCGVEMMMFDPTDDDLENSKPVHELRAATESLGFNFDLAKIRIAICPECQGLLYLGQRVTITGEVVE